MRRRAELQVHTIEDLVVSAALRVYFDAALRAACVVSHGVLRQKTLNSVASVVKRLTLLMHTEQEQELVDLMLKMFY